MAITAINAVIAYVMLVTEWNRLVERHPHVGGIGRPVDRRGRPTCTTNQNDDPDDDYPGVNVRARREELGHEELKFLLRKHESRMQVDWDACSHFLARQGDYR